MLVAVLLVAATISIVTVFDEVFTVTISDSSARFLHFHDGELVNFEFTSKVTQDELKSQRAGVPQWYIRFGDWLIVAGLLSVVFLLRVFLQRRTRSSETQAVNQ